MKRIANDRGCPSRWRIRSIKIDPSTPRTCCDTASQGRRCERTEQASAGKIPDQRAPIQSARAVLLMTCGTAWESSSIGGELAHPAAGALREHRPQRRGVLACLPRMLRGPTHLWHRRRCERAELASAGNVPDQRAPIRIARAILLMMCGAARELCGRGGALAHSAAGVLREHRPSGAAFLACLPRMPHGPTHLQYRRRCGRASERAQVVSLISARQYRAHVCHPTDEAWHCLGEACDDLAHSVAGALR